MENGVNIKLTKKLVLRILNIIFTCFFFIPTMLVSCSSYGFAEDDVLKVEVSAKTVTFGTSVMGTQIDGAGWTIISLIIPIAVLVILCLKHKASIVIGMILTICNNVLYVMYGNGIKEKAAESYAEFSYKPAYYFLMILFAVYYVVSIASLLFDKKSSSGGFQNGSANEFFGNLGQKISATSQEAVQKTKDMANVMSLNSENSGLDKKNDAIQKQIGTVIYDQIFAGKSIDDVNQMIDKSDVSTEVWNKICEFAIQIKQNDLARTENERKILELKGELPCPKCGNMIPKDAVFCSKCGEKSPFANQDNTVAEVASEAPVKMCAKCGKPLLDDAAFCKYCGTKI